MEFKLFGRTIFERVPDKAVNLDVKRPIKSDPYSRYVTWKTQIYRASKDVGDFKRAVMCAEDWQNPQRYELYQIYRNIEIDAHLTSCVEQRKNLILSKNFNVVGPDGKINEEKTKLIRGPWFKEFISLSMDSENWGYSLIQFGEIKNDQFTSVELIPRQFVKPEFGIVTKMWTDIQGNKYLEPPFSNWCMGVGDPCSLGLYMKAAPLIIWKQGALGAWADYQESYGSPIRFMKTNVSDEKTRDDAEEMMRNFGVNQWAVVDTEDDVQLLEGNKTDAHKVFDELIKQIDSQISKLYLNQTGTTDEKAFSGSAQVHERVLERIEEKLEYWVENLLNHKLAPFMKNLGLDIGEGSVIVAGEAEEISAIDRAKMVVDLIKTGMYKVAPQILEEEYGIKLEAIENVDNTQNIQNYYK